ncbi:hypothetical protein [Stanieria cyanosphaera]|uniref:hypothetical protein n=1 Tax=Stanieria cyanosphaera TaxID=102116 RepID=UPI0005A0C328|nr:hypothetical protein [Stanieria cyanosphaera]
MRILGEPKTLTELEANYRELIKREHPDAPLFHQKRQSSDLLTRAPRSGSLRDRFTRIAREYWQQLKPTAVIAPTELNPQLCLFALLHLKRLLLIFLKPTFILLKIIRQNAVQ